MVAGNIFILDNSYNVKSTDELFYEDYHEWAYERSVKFSDSSIIFGDCFWIVLYEAYGKHIFSGVKKMGHGDNVCINWRCCWLLTE